MGYRYIDRAVPDGMCRRRSGRLFDIESLRQVSVNSVVLHDGGPLGLLPHICIREIILLPSSLAKTSAHEVEEVKRPYKEED
jgi:hypothetical protein